MTDSHELLYPIAHPRSLSADAQQVYEAFPGHATKLDRDLLDPRTRNRHIGRGEAAAFEPSARLLAAIDELESVGLATYDADYQSLRLDRVHEQYTVAHGAGPYLVEVRIVPPALANNPSHEGVLLAVLDGADMSIRQAEGAWAYALIEAAHSTATDFEHDTSKAARVQVAGPTLLSMFGPVTRYAGTLTDARLYPIGTDVLTQTDGDTRPGTCDGDGYVNHEPHPFAPYLPPERADIEALLPSVVTLTLRLQGGSQ